MQCVCIYMKQIQIHFVKCSHRHLALALVLISWVSFLWHFQTEISISMTYNVAFLQIRCFIVDGQF